MGPEEIIIPRSIVLHAIIMRVGDKWMIWYLKRIERFYLIPFMTRIRPMRVVYRRARAMHYMVPSWLWDRRQAK